MPRMQAPITRAGGAPAHLETAQRAQRLVEHLDATDRHAGNGDEGIEPADRSATITMISTGRAIPPMRVPLVGANLIEVALEYPGGRPKTDSNPSRLDFGGPPRW